MNELKIHDIKALSTIPDISFYIFLLIIVLAISVLGLLIYLLFKYFKSRSNEKKIIFKQLQNMPLNNAKQDAYIITKKGRKLISNDREEKLFEELIEELNQYKYKKNVQSMHKHTQEKFRRFMDALDV